MFDKIIKLFKILLQLLPFSDPWLFFAFVSVIVWFIARFFPNFVLNIIRKTCVLIYWIVTFFAWERCVYKVVFYLEYQFGIEKIFLLFFRQVSDECIHCILLGIVFYIWMMVGIFLALYEVRNWKYVAKKKVETYS